MSKLYVIVHQQIVEEAAQEGSAEAKKVFAELTRIKLDQKYFISPENPLLLPSLPAPSSDLEVLVCGGLRWICCTFQLYTLRREGYTAALHYRACYDLEGRRLWGASAEFLQVVPELREEIEAANRKLEK